MIKIRRHLRKDIEYRVEWLNNPLVSRYVWDSMHQKTTRKKQEQWFDAYEKAKNKKFFTICDGLKPIGMMWLSNICRVDKNADVFIAIGDDAYRGRGIGKMALRWLLDYAFDKLTLHKVKLGVIEDNVSAIRLYESLGFETE